MLTALQGWSLLFLRKKNRDGSALGHGGLGGHGGDWGQAHCGSLANKGLHLLVCLLGAWDPGQGQCAWCSLGGTEDVSSTSQWAQNLPMGQCLLAMETQCSG